MRITLSTFFVACTFFSIAQNQPPLLSNVSAYHNNDGTVIVSYDLQDTENDAVEVRLLISADGGETYLSQAGTVSGDFGYPVTAGAGKQIVWTYDTITNIYDYKIRLVADDRQAPDIQQLVNSVDSVRLHADLQFVQGVRHYQANPTHLEAVKDFIGQRMNEAGLFGNRQDFQESGYTGQNIIATKQGFGKEDSVYIVDAHFDSVDDAPGADDNGSGVVGMLETMRVLAPYNFAKSIRFIGFDFEEAGLKGSIKYVQDGIPAHEKIQGVFNYEMIGYYSEQVNSQQMPAGFELLFPTQYNTVVADSFRGNFIVNTGDAESNALNAAFHNAALSYVPELKVVSVVLPGNGTIASDFRRSDHAPFWDADIPALMLTDGANFRNPYYHTPNDSISKLNFTFMSNVVKATVAAVAELAGIQNSTKQDVAIFPAGISANALQCTSNVFPNPVSNSLTVQAGDCFAKGFSATLYDVRGKVVAENKTEKSELSIDTQNLPKGVYFAVLQADGNRTVQKVVKQ